MKVSQVTFPDTYKVVEQSIAACVEYNKLNKSYIDLGMVEGVRPDPRVLAELQLEEARKTGAVALVKQLVPGCKVETSGDSWHTLVDNVRVALKRERIGHGYGYRSSGRRYVWRSTSGNKSRSCARVTRLN